MIFQNSVFSNMDNFLLRVAQITPMAASSTSTGRFEMPSYTWFTVNASCQLATLILHLILK